MAQVILTYKLMPTSPDADLEKVKEACNAVAKKFGTEIGKSEIQPIAFGLNALILYFVLEEGKGSPDALEEALLAVEGVQSITCTDVRRALG